LNITCICTNDEVKADIQTCLLSNCTIREALGRPDPFSFSHLLPVSVRRQDIYGRDGYTESEKYSYNTCGITGEDRTPLVWHLGIAFMITGLSAFGLRCLERLRSHTWGFDDWAITIVTVILVPMGALTVPLSESGLGLDMWNVSANNINQVLYVSLVMTGCSTQSRISLPRNDCSTSIGKRSCTLSLSP
jgi:hypothetical protein